jgi:hypothetical protein
MTTAGLLNGAKEKLGPYKHQFKDFADCASIAIIGASPGLFLYELNFPDSLCLSIAAAGAVLAEIAYAKYSDKITEALGLSQSYQPYPPQQGQYQGTL